MQTEYGGLANWEMCGWRYAYALDDEIQAAEKMIEIYRERLISISWLCAA